MAVVDLDPTGNEPKHVALANQYVEIAPLLEARGMRGTFYLPTANLDQANRMTVAQALDLHARGHDLQMNGTSTDAAIGTGGFTTMAALLNDIEAQKIWFAARGLHVPEHIAYPGGVHRIAGTRSQTTFSASSGSNTLTVANATGIANGRKVTADGVPAGTTVTNVAGTTITISANTTKAISAGTGITFVDTSGPFHTGKVQAALKGAGIKSARTTGGGSWLTRYGPSGAALVHPAQTTTGQSFAQMQTAINLALLRGTTLEFFIHAATASPVGGEVSLSALTQALDYIKARVDAGEAVLLTKRAWWARDGNASFPA